MFDIESAMALSAFSMAANLDRTGYPKMAVIHSDFDGAGTPLPANSTYYDLSTYMPVDAFITNDNNAFSVVNNHLHLCTTCCTGYIVAATVGGNWKEASENSALLNVSVQSEKLNGRVAFAKMARPSDWGFTCTFIGGGLGDADNRVNAGLDFIVNACANNANGFTPQFMSLAVIVF